MTKQPKEQNPSDAFDHQIVASTTPVDDNYNYQVVITVKSEDKEGLLTPLTVLLLHILESSIAISGRMGKPDLRALQALSKALQLEYDSENGVFGGDNQPEVLFMRSQYVMKVKTLKEAEDLVNAFNNIYIPGLKIRASASF